jgi:hypothetical protein
VEVTDTPSGMRLVAVGQTAGSFANGLWRIGRLEVGESVTLTGDYKVTAQQAGNSAVARGEVSDPVSADNAARVTLRVGAAHASGGDHHHGNGGGGAGGGGGLPLADTGNPVDRAVLGLGLMLVLAGGLVLVGRRRRARS